MTTVDSRRRGFGALVLLVWSATAVTADGRRFATLEGDEPVAFAVELPDAYDPERTYPVLIGPGEGVPGADRCYFWRGERPPGLDWILVETHALFGPAGPERMARLLDRLSDTYRVEGFHLLGFSANSAFVFEVAAALGSRIASVTGIPGHPRARRDRELRALAEITVHMVVGEKDAFWRREAQQADERLRRLGVDTRLEIVPGGGHFLDALIGEGLFARMERMRHRDPP